MHSLSNYFGPRVQRDTFEDGRGTMSRREMWSQGYVGLKKTTSSDAAELSQILVPRVEPIWPVIRTKFADTAFWIAALTTAPDGTAEVEFTLPESLTTWKVKAWTMGPGTRVGQAETEIVTTKDLLVRLQAPRFFVEKDEVVLSANVHNKLKTEKAVQVILELDGSVLEPLGETVQSVEVAAGSERRVDWRVKVAHDGQAVIRMKALTDEESDAAQMSFPAHVHGMRKTEAFVGTIRPDQEKRSSSSASRPNANRTNHGSRCGTPPHWPVPWSTPSPISPTTPTAALSRP